MAIDKKKTKIKIRNLLHTLFAVQKKRHGPSWIFQISHGIFFAVNERNEICNIFTN